MDRKRSRRSKTSSALGRRAASDGGKPVDGLEKGGAGGKVRK
jgi:hypothetical protein